MRSTVTARGQTVIPAAIRKRFGLGASDRLEWIVENGGIRVVPICDDPVLAFRGRGAGGATQRHLAEREQDKRSEVRSCRAQVTSSIE
jgi:AbrB family looped-hinge helix DNA binding protein